MDQFPVVNLPDCFTQILAANMQVSGQNFSNLHSFVLETKSFHALAQKLFKDMGNSAEVGRIIKSLGWVGFRNRMANAFLQFESNGRYPESLDETLLIDVINTEEDFKPYEVSGYSRAFLLGFYIKMADIHSRKRGKSKFTLDFTCISYMDFSNSKFPKIDWVYLQLVHFNHFLGDQKLKNHLSNRSGFEKIYSELSNEQQDMMAKNLLAYGCSIGEADMFYETRV